MDIDYSLVPWGMAFAAFMYIIGNGVWMNNLVRSNLWWGWLLWSLSALFIVLGSILIQQRLGSEGNFAEILVGNTVETYWIIATLYALMSIPAAAGVMFRQSVGWTRFGVIATGLILFIPLGIQVQDPDNSHLLLSIGVTHVVVILMWIWSALLDCEPEHKRKTVPLEEMGQ